MSRTTWMYLTSVRCDLDGCSSVFRSGSEEQIVREQAALAGWHRVPRSRVFVDGKQIGSGRERADVCPEHASTIRTPSEAATMRKQNRAEHLRIARAS
jgi:hypothetical protein